MYVLTVENKPEYHTSSSRQARRACRKSNRNAKPGQGQWETHTVRPLPDVDMVMTASAKTWDKLRCPSCGSILNTDGNLVQISGKSMKVEFSDFSKLVQNIKSLLDYHEAMMISDKTPPKEREFHGYAIKVLGEINAEIERSGVQ